MRLELKDNGAHIYEVPWEYSVKLMEGEDSPTLINDFLNNNGVPGSLAKYLETWFESCPSDGKDQYQWEGNDTIKEVWIHPDIPNVYD